ncbi:MAG TPA: MFS transporter [Acidobacteriaceae bacterium]|nr:MFS transporter [Acidobacteriaceae bacterium]
MKKRHGVLGLLCAVSAITFLDRLALPIAEPGIRGELHLTPDQWGWVLSAYVLANALFEIPSGALGDRNGQRRELTRIVAWWSAFTALTSWCRSLWQMAAARFCFGIGAAGAYPNAAGAIARWFPKREHARAQGFVWGASRLGGALAFPLLAPIAAHFGWSAIFWLLGALGVVWAAFWWSWFRDDPHTMHALSADELAAIRGDSPNGSGTRRSVPWRKLFALPHLWLIVAAYFCYGWGSWFYFGWFATWMVRGAGFTVAQMSVFASFPFVMGLIGNLAGGEISERLAGRYGPRSAYRWTTASCLCLGSALMLAMSFVRGHAAVVALAALGFGIMDLMLPSAWAMCMSLGGDFSGAATGAMNTAGNLGGWFCTVVFGYVVTATGNYNLPLRAVAAMVLIAAVLFARVDCTRGMADRKTSWSSNAGAHT